MPYGLSWSEEFVEQLDDKEFRNEFVADQVRAHVALLIRALREQEGREWTQTELGARAGMPQNVISRLEDPDYGKFSLQTALKIAAAYDLPLWIDMPEWEDWFRLIGNLPNDKIARHGFNAKNLSRQAQAAKLRHSTGSAGKVIFFRPQQPPITSTSTPTKGQLPTRNIPIVEPMSAVA
jgi:transcriptional regulator with XRE-family HTH domain